MTNAIGGRRGNSRPKDRVDVSLESLLSLELGSVWAAFRAQGAGFKLACAYLVLEYVRPQSIWPQIDVLPWTQITVIIGLMSVASEIGRRGPIKSPTNVLILIYTMIVIMSIIVAYDPGVSLSRWDVFLPWVVIYFFIVNAVVGRQRFFLFLGLFLLCSFKMSQHGFRSWVSAGFGYSRWGVTGAPGFFHNSGEVGIQMSIFLPISIMFLAALWKKLSVFKRVFLSLLPVTAVGTIIAANSRGAVVGALAALMWLVLIGRSKIKAAVGLALVAVVGWVVAPPQFLARFEAMGSDPTSMTRLTYWRDGIDIWRNHPLLGVGFENWLPFYSANYSGLSGYYVAAQLPHNILIQAAAELGTLGLVMFLIMFITTFALNKRSRNLAQASGDDFLVRVSHGFDAAMIGFFVSAQFVTVLYYPYFWIGLTMSVLLYTAAREAAGVPFSSRPRYQAGSRRRGATTPE